MMPAKFAPEARLTTQETKVTTSKPNFGVDGRSTLSKSIDVEFAEKLRVGRSEECNVNEANTLEIPLFDLKKIELANGAERTILINDLCKDLKEVGFIAIKAETLTPFYASVDREMKKYFSRSLEEKMKDFHNNNGQTGFAPQGNETAAGAKKADIKETYFIPPNFTQWPENLPSFKEIMEPYHKELTKYASQLMGYIAEYLGEATEDVSESVNSATNLVRLAYYPAPKPTDDPEAVWAAAHFDLNLITLLPATEVPGLQLLTKEGGWKYVGAQPGYCIINAGEQLRMKTAGKFDATLHQVVNPGGIFAKRARYASIFFGSWSPSFSLKPYEKCIKEMTEGMSVSEMKEYLKQFPDVSVQDNLLSRLIEMKAIPKPDEELVKNLRQKGLLRQPPEELVARFPALFNKGAD